MILTWSEPANEQFAARSKRNPEPIFYFSACLDRCTYGNLLLTSHLYTYTQPFKKTQAGSKQASAPSSLSFLAVLSLHHIPSSHLMLLLLPPPSMT
jgi:hypothetical protein